MYAGEKSFLIRWIGVTLFAFVIALAATNALPAGTLTPAIAGVIAGLTIGIAQWLVLREHATWASEWVAAIALASGLMIGAPSGAALVWLLRHPYVHSRSFNTAPLGD